MPGVRPRAIGAAIFLAGLFSLLASHVAAGVNALAGNPSPYLAMHAQDPVQWREWGPGALAQARSSNKPLFVSSGYFACHWCHVMQRESYRNPAIAVLLNRHFVPVKLDRELHPALDAYLIGFVERTAGQAGWPLNVFLTPEGYPLLGLTYAPPEDFEALLRRVGDAWGRRGETLSDLARRAAAERAAEQAAVESGEPEQIVPPARLAERLKAQALRFGDGLSGGFGGQARFPMAPNLSALLALQAREPDPELAAFLRTTLDAMMNLGLRDHLGGGFFRYTVDPDWHTPHFEKMLYTQALLAPLYLEAARVLDRPEYRAVARDTLDFMLREMRHGDGGFIASLSAVDERGIEGGHYLWRPEELEERLEPSERRLLALVWRLDGPARLEGGLLPMRGLGLAEAAKKLGLSLPDAERSMDRARQRLHTARKERRLPRDGKRLASWNGLALSALSAGARALEGEVYRAAARRLRDFLVGRLWDGQKLYRAVSAGGRIGAAALEDYAFVARGLRDWARLIASDEDLALSSRLTQLAWERFRVEGGWQLASVPLLPAIPPEGALADSPLPSPTAILIAIALEMDDETLAPLVRDAMRDSAPWVAANPFAFAAHVLLLLKAPHPKASPSS
jgi:uncharacterized protein YyaL (SSP411 family)